MGSTLPGTKHGGQMGSRRLWHRRICGARYSSSGYIATSLYGSVWTVHQLSPAHEIDGATFGCAPLSASVNPARQPQISFRRPRERRGRPPRRQLTQLHTGALSATAHIDSSLSMPPATLRGRARPRTVPPQSRRHHGRFRGTSTMARSGPTCIRRRARAARQLTATA